MPWAAVTLILPALAALSPDIVGQLGDLERCLAWTAIEMARR